MKINWKMINRPISTGCVLKPNASNSTFLLKSIAKTIRHRNVFT